MSTTALALMTTSFQRLNVFLPGESIPANDSTYALTELNLIVSAMAQDTGMIPVVERETFSLVANQGGPSNPYTIGVGGNFNTARPPSQEDVTGAGLLLGNTSPAVEIPRAVLTDDQYQAIQVKELTNSLFTNVYYNPTYSSGLGRINLWPVPDTAVNSLVLYLQKQIAAFATLTTSYDFPPGYDDMFSWLLMERLAVTYDRTLSARAQQMVTASKELIQRANTKIADVPQDLAFLGAGNRRYGYNINTGTGGGAS